MDLLAAFFILAILAAILLGYCIGRGAQPPIFNVTAHFQMPPIPHHHDRPEPEQDEWWKRNGHTDQFEAD